MREKKSKKFFTQANIKKESKNKPQIKNYNSSSLAYIIYTSGSTGDLRGNDYSSKFINLYFKFKKLL